MKYLFALLFAISSQFVFAQTQNANGNWNVPGNWIGNNIGDNITEDVTVNANSTIISTDSYTIGSLTMANNADLVIQAGGVLIIGSSSDPGNLTTGNNATIIVNGDLELWGDLVVNNNLDLQITGEFNIRGNVILNNNADLSVGGNLVVDGNFTAKNNADFVVDGSIDIGGDLNVGNNGDLIINPGGSFTIGGACNWEEEFCDLILPVDLLSFSARPAGKLVLVNWSTALEKDNDYFQVQVSRDGQEYRELARITGAGNTEKRQDYSFTDQSPLPGTSYYRLVQVDFNGERAIYSPVKVDRSFDGGIGLYPNPVRQNEAIQLYTGGNSDDKVNLTLYSLNGAVLWNGGFEGNHHELDLPGGLERGTYLLEVRTGNIRKLHRVVLQ